MQTRCRIQATGQNNGDKLRNYTKSSKRLKSPDLNEFKGHYEKGFVHKENVPDSTFINQKKSNNWKKTTPQFKEYQNKVIKEHGWE